MKSPLSLKASNLRRLTMRAGISSYTYTWAVGVPGYPPPQPLSPFDLLDRAAALGLACLQIADNCPLHALPPENLTALATYARALQLDIETGTRGLSPENLARYLDITATLHSHLLRIVVDAPGFSPSEDDIVAIVRSFIPRLSRDHIILAIENHDRFPAQSYARIIERIGSPHVGICLDTVNSLGAGDGLGSVIDALAPYTVNLHVKDFSIRRAHHMMGFIVEGTPAGQGLLPLNSLLSLLTRYGRCQSAIIELWTPPEPALDATIAKEAAWAAASVHHLKHCLASISERDYVTPNF